MSLARVHTVNKSQKDQGNCEVCKVKLPKGSSYRWFSVGFRSKYKHVRCMKTECNPKSSQLESSKYADIYAAQENFVVDDLETKDDIEEAVHEFAEAVRQVASEYNDAAINPNTGEVFNTLAEERGQALEEVADELEGWEYNEEPEPCESHAEHDDGIEGGIAENCNECKEQWQEFLDDARTAAREAVDGIEMP